MCSVMKNFMSGVGILLFAMIILGAPTISAAGSIKVKLESSAMSMFAPARFVVTGTLIGGSDSDPALHCLTEEWVYQRVYETVTNHEENKSIRSSPCNGQTQPDSFTRGFKNEFTFFEVGRYAIRLLLRNPQGKVVTSSTISLRVLQPADPMYQSEEEKK